MNDLRRVRRDLTRLQAENRQLKDQHARHQDWLATSHLPAAIRHLIRTLQELHHMSDPIPPSPWDQSSRSADRPEPGASTRRYRNAEKRALTRIRQLTASLQATIDGTPDPRPKPGKCPHCGRAGRFGATHCDRDGTQLHKEETR